ncbi:MAG: hypothetical protein RLZZ244_1728, partial [Verrucomicrobiota bacterium]
MASPADALAYLPDMVEVALSFPEETRSSGTLTGILAAMALWVLALAAPAATLYWEGVPHGSFAESANWSLSLGGDVPWSGGMPGAEDTLVFSIGSAFGTQSGILGGVSSVGGLRFQHPSPVLIGGGGGEPVLRLG